MASTNTVKYGLKGCHYAVATIAADGSATYSAPKPLKGAVSLSLEPQGELTPFYADDIVYFIGNSSSGYSGDLELAVIPDDFKKDVLGFAEDGNGILYEKANAPVVHFALIFTMSGDVHKTKHVMYNCTASRPSVASQTKGETIEPQTESITITSTSIYNAAISDDIFKARCLPTQTTQYSAWETTVYQIVSTS